MLPTLALGFFASLLTRDQHNDVNEINKVFMYCSSTYLAFWIPNLNPYIIGK